MESEVICSISKCPSEIFCYGQMLILSWWKKSEHLVRNKMQKNWGAKTLKFKVNFTYLVKKKMWQIMLHSVLLVDQSIPFPSPKYSLPSLKFIHWSATVRSPKTDMFIWPPFRKLASGSLAGSFPTSCVSSTGPALLAYCGKGARPTGTA